MSAPGKNLSKLTLSIPVFLGAAVTLVICALMIDYTRQMETSSNDVLAQTTLRKISDTLEEYLIKNHAYPMSLEHITMPEYPYLISAYFKGVHHGFEFTYNITASGYTIHAEPVSRDSGTKSYVIKTGGKFDK